MTKIIKIKGERNPDIDVRNTALKAAIEANEAIKKELEKLKKQKENE
jgi:hypothetical protein